ncbi:hypothetical protein [Mycobacteroides abscessus]|uniref:hypothetical protein n=1 Tax=Mycobacteroides abscessus TaxID=36809 RepID=UPI001042FD38|nr:hypothetical protein [Mycobacteroides abscessus]
MSEIDVSGLIKNWVQDQLDPDIDWSTSHEQLWEHLGEDVFGSLSDDERDVLAGQVIDGVKTICKVAKDLLFKAGLL